MLEEFKKFIAAGNVIDLAVGVIVGGMFGKIVTSFVEDLINPLIGMLGSRDFSNYYIALKDADKVANLPLAEAKKLGVPVLAYGNFASVCVNTLLTAFVIFLVVKQINRLRTKEEAPPAPPAAPEPPKPTSEELLGEIRDLLKARQG